MTASIHSYRIRVFAVSVLAGLLLSWTTPERAKSRLPSWDSFTSQFIEAYFAYHPAFAVQAGRHDFDGRLPDWRPDSLNRAQRWLADERRTALQYGADALSNAQRFERDYLLAVIRRDLFWLHSAQAPFRNPMYYAEALDPNVYVSRPYAPPEQRLRAFIAYAANIPQAAAQIRANLRPPLPVTFIDVGKTLFDGLAKFYGSDARAAFAQVADPQLQRRFETTQKQAADALSGLSRWLESQRASGAQDHALGPERFREMLRETEQVEIPLDVLENAGRQDLERNLAALRAECGRYAPGSPLATCVEQVESRKPPSGPVAEARRQLVTLRAFLDRNAIVSIPGREAAEVAESPPYQRWNPAYIDIPGPFERWLPSVYYVAPPDPAWSASEKAAYVPSQANLLFISAHEVWPGHFLHHLHAVRAGSPIGRLFYSYAFAEGWAHYAEELMWEVGFEQGSADTHIGQLLNALIRNVRFLSAIGLHTQGMSLGTSERMFREFAFRDDGNARQQAARGTFDPAYLNYTLGKLMIRKLREDWTGARGGRAAWKPFHDALLSHGAPPIPLVRKAMLPGSLGSEL